MILISTERQYLYMCVGTENGWSKREIEENQDPLKYKTNPSFTVATGPDSYTGTVDVRSSILSGGIVLDLLWFDGLIGQNPLGSLVHPPALALITGSAEDTGDELHAPQTIIIRGDGVRDSCRVGIRVDDADGRDVVQSALVKEDLVLHRVETHHQVRFQDGALRQVRSEFGELLVDGVDNLRFTRAQDLLTVREAPWNPPLEDVIAPGELRGSDDALFLALPRADEEDDAASTGDFLHHFGRSAQVRRRDVQRDDVDAVAYAKDVSRILWVPSRGGVAEVGL
jgi:hypothetical protein